MITRRLISACIVLLVGSCNNTGTQDKPKVEIPKALEDKSSSYGVLYRSGQGDLVQALYNELAEKDQELKKLEESIRDLKENQADSTKAFDDFSGKNQRYYLAASHMIDKISDSLLKTQMRTIIANDSAEFSSMISKHNTLLKTVEERNKILYDLHTVLKITKTLPLMNQYQKEKLPPVRSLEEFIKEQERIIKLADTISKK